MIDKTVQYDPGHLSICLLQNISVEKIGKGRGGGVAIEKVFWLFSCLRNIEDLLRSYLNSFCRRIPALAICADMGNNKKQNQQLFHPIFIS